MKYTTAAGKKSTVKVTIDFSKEEWEDALAQSFSKTRGKYTVPGFRKGKAPRSVVENYYGKAVLFDEAFNVLYSKHYPEILSKERENFTAVGDPELSVDDLSDEKLTLSAVIPVKPEVKIGAYKGLEIKKYEYTVTDEEVTREVNKILDREAKTVDVTDRPCAEGDTVNINFSGSVDGEKFEGGTAEKYSLTLGSNTFIPGFEAQVAGHKIGETFDVKVTFPADYHAENLAGKDARFAVKVHEVRKHQLPELNDELAKSVGHESVDKLREHIRTILTEQYDEAAKRDMRNELLDILADKVKLDLPENLVDQEYNMAKQEYERAAKNGSTEKWDEKQERRDAERRVKLGLILAEWGTQNKVEVTRDDLQQAVWAEAARYPDPKQVFEFYNKNQNALAMLRGMIFERKALDAMLTHVKTKEKSVKPSELFQQSDVR